MKDRLAQVQRGNQRAGDIAEIGTALADWVARPDGARAVAELRKPPVIALLQTHVYGVVPPPQSENPAIVAALPS
jgi:hypothetical protein